MAETTNEEQHPIIQIQGTHEEAMNANDDASHANLALAIIMIVVIGFVLVTLLNGSTGIINLIRSMWKSRNGDIPVFAPSAGQLGDLAALVLVLMVVASFCLPIISALIVGRGEKQVIRRYRRSGDVLGVKAERIIEGVRPVSETFSGDPDDYVSDHLINRFLWHPQGSSCTLHVPAYVSPTIWRKQGVDSDSRMAWIDLDITGDTLTVTHISPIPVEEVERDERRGSGRPPSIMATRPDGLLTDHRDWLL
ncbi:hypothetical protein [Bifidobacterium sp. SO1]|uniref:hypothetical protein n=1 Tax=Bifidobacterium sp. SO1 TaxID=2809029 RepID=UPI001BDCEFA4|nr:hypothetical protein [Bifidobacterium sp. SO1]MBT1162973.1 hypothetical protein [Bifidobacterium sp. SO1]